MHLNTSLQGVVDTVSDGDSLGAQIGAILAQRQVN